MRAAVVQSNIILSPLALASTPGVPPGGPSRAYRHAGRDAPSMLAPDSINGRTIVWQGWLYADSDAAWINLYVYWNPAGSGQSPLKSFPPGSIPVGVWTRFQYVGKPSHQIRAFFYQIDQHTPYTTAVWFGDWTISVL